MAERKTPLLVAEIDPVEMAIRMCEASYGLTRPTASAADALAAMDEDCRDGWLRAAAAGLHYVNECLAKAQRPS